MSLARSLAGVVAGLALMAAPARGQDASAPPPQWKNPSEVQLQVAFPGEGYRAEWRLFRCTCGDLLIRTRLDEPGESVDGDIALIGNRAVLTRGFDEDAAALVSVDAPALMMQLALRLLERVEPAGPAAVTGRRAVRAEEATRALSLDTGAAVGAFPAPWSVSGSLWPVGDSARRFDLNFTFTAAGADGSPQQGELGLKGTAEFARVEFPLATDMPLEDWSLSWRDPDDPLAGAEEPPATLDALRRALKATPR